MCARRFPHNRRATLAFSLKARTCFQMARFRSSTCGRSVGHRTAPARRRHRSCCETIVAEGGSAQLLSSAQLSPQRRALIRSENRKGPPFSSGAPRPARPLGATLPRPDSGEASGLIAPCEGKCESFRSRLSLRLVGLSTLALHLMSRAQLRELMALFVIGSALTVAVFFLALWLLPDKPFTTFLFPRFP